MNDTDAVSYSGAEEPSRLVEELPQRILDTYSRLWQLETWLRRMVYVELRALAGDSWTSNIRIPKGPMEADKRLTHMPTPENDILSYVQFSDLRGLVSDNWRLFEHFLPPKSIWEAKLEEVSQIRHRIAHFRKGHKDDLQRVTQLLRDIDQGFWRFCTSYNDPHPVLPQSDDPVEQTFLHLDSFPWSLTSDGSWSRIGVADPEARFDVIVEVICRPWAKWVIPIAGQEGFIYDITLHARQNRMFNYKQFLEQTCPLHKHMVHVCLDDYFRGIRLTLPAVVGASQVIDIVKQIIEAILYCLSFNVRGSDKEGSVQNLADIWPEYVLGPQDPLSFLTPEMQCSFFGV